MELKLLALAAIAPLAAAQTAEYVWASAVVTLFGERTPLLAKNYSTLTATGAAQMNAAGALFRQRYLAPANTTHNMTIVGINPDLFDGWQTQLVSMQDVFVQQSAQAFMAGLYPPTTSANTSSSGEGNDGGPVGGLQYPQYYFASSYDPSYLYLNGSTQCPAFDSSVQTYLDTQEFADLASAAAPFYDGLDAQFADGLDVIPGSPRWLGDAYQVWDWLQFELNSSVATAHVSESQVQEARYLADAYMAAVYANMTADGGIRAVGGSTLAAAIASSLSNAVAINATEYKLNLYFPAPEAFMSLLALLGVPDYSSQLSGMPDIGSSLVFELYSSADAAPTNATTGLPAFPAESDLYVRMLLRNGTASAQNIDQVPVFGHGAPGTSDSNFAGFLQDMGGVALSDPSAWCELCGSGAVWCAAYTDGAVGLDSDTCTSGPVTPVIAGVIGALVALAAAGLLLLAAMVLAGVRFRREQGKGALCAGGRRSDGAAGAGKRRSDLGGFKGGEKLASDLDLPQGGAEGSGATFGASVVDDAAGGQGHRRVESWEMREGRRRQSVDSHRDGGVVKEIESV